MTVETLYTSRASKPVGPYSHARKCGNLIITSGQIALDPVTNELATGVRESTRMVLNNLLAIVEEGGGSLETIAKVDIFVRSMDDFDEINEVYVDFFKDVKPARVLVEVSRLPKDAVIEAAMIAFTK